MDDVKLLEIVASLAPDNNHPIPIAEAWDGENWTVDIQIRNETLDLDATAVAPTLSRARSKAIQRIRKTKTLYAKHGYVPN